MNTNNNNNEVNNKNVCIKLDAEESGRLNFIMHEIHGVLSSIDKEINYIAKGDFSSPRQQNVIKERALTAQRLSTDLRNLLDFWQISNSDDYFDNAVMRPQKLWSQFYYLNSYLKSVIAKKNLTYTIYPQPSHNNRSPVADYQGYPIINAIANILIENAIKYSPPADEIICEFDELPDALVITVENNGPYVLPEEIDQLFLCGMRGKYAGATENGHGYGLNMLKLIVDAHDGTITISSSKDYTFNNKPYGKFKCVIELPKYTDEDFDEFEND